MIIDFHCHIGIDCADKEYEKLNFTELKQSMDKWGIDKAVVFPINEGDGKLIKKSLEILERSKKEKWIIPFLRVDPKNISKEEFVDLLDKGFKGVKLHSRSQNFEADNPKYFWIYEVCDKKNIPILFHSSVREDISHPKRIFKVAKKFPNLKIIIAHFFGGDHNLAKEAIKYPNIYVDTSINHSIIRGKQVVKKMGFKNLLFASDVPYDSQGVALLKVKESGLSEGDEKMILSGNALEVLGME